jgi:hypothetical protein
MDIRQDSGEKAFVLANGDKARSVEELQEKLLGLNANDYDGHANGQKNDFSNWVRDVYGDQKLASSLEKAKSPADAAAAIKRRLMETAPKISTETVKAPAAKHTTVKRVAKPEVVKLNIKREAPKALKSSGKMKKLKLHASKSKVSFLRRFLTKKSISQSSVVPDAHKFLTAYISMQRPTVSHLYFSKGISDFMLGITIGIIVGIILAHVIV